MKIKYLGSEVTEVFNMIWKPGEVQDVADKYAAEKLRFNPQFEAVDAKDRPKAGDAPNPGEPSKGLDALVRRTTERVNKAIIDSIDRRKAEAA